MPIIEDLKLSETSRLIIWEISETINELKTKVLLSENSLKLLNQRKSEVQKKQFLAIRNILSELSIDDRDMKYKESGRPYVIGGQNISLSHSDTFAAVILSDNVVGIDIEIMNDRILKIKDKFLETELNYPEKLEVATALIYWNIKESIFKAVHKEGVDFKKNILVLPLNMKKNTTKSWFIDNDEIYSFETHFKISKKYTLAFVIKN